MLKGAIYSKDYTASVFSSTVQPKMQLDSERLKKRMIWITCKNGEANMPNIAPTKIWKAHGDGENNMN